MSTAAPIETGGIDEEERVFRAAVDGLLNGNGVELEALLVVDPDELQAATAELASRPSRTRDYDGLGSAYKSLWGDLFRVASERAGQVESSSDMLVRAGALVLAEEVVFSFDDYKYDHPKGAFSLTQGRRNEIVQNVVRRLANRAYLADYLSIIPDDPVSILVENTFVQEAAKEESSPGLGPVPLDAPSSLPEPEPEPEIRRGSKTWCTDASILDVVDMIAPDISITRTSEKRVLRGLFDPTLTRRYSQEQGMQGTSDYLSELLKLVKADRLIPDDCKLSQTELSILGRIIDGGWTVQELMDDMLASSHQPPDLKNQADFEIHLKSALLKLAEARRIYR